MRHLLLGLLSTATFVFFCQGEAEEPSSPTATTQAPFQAFTGKITRNKVRIRLQPSLDGKILRELNKDDMVVALGETEEFYVIAPPSDLKGYIFRTFVLDETVEGKHVNVRLAPDLEAPVLVQLNSGDRIRGVISSSNNKWLEIAPPEGTKLYISKDYVEKVGDVHFLSSFEKRKREATDLINQAEAQTQEELAKAFENIHMDEVQGTLNKLIHQYTDFPHYSARAKELLNHAQETYLEKKLAYLEARAQAQMQVPQAAEPQAASEPIKEPAPQSAHPKPIPRLDAINAQAAVWLPVETALYQEWAKQNNGSPDQYYDQQKRQAVVLKGVIEPYIRSLRNKPGDYLLISKNTRLPMAYLYSTKVDLQGRIGREVTLMAVPRPNNQFAHPAYFVLTAE